MDGKSKFVNLLSSIWLVSFTVLYFSSCSSSGGWNDPPDFDDMDLDFGTPPAISNLTYSPQTMTLNSDEEKSTVSGSIDFVDQDGDVSVLTVSIFDSENNLIDTITKNIQGISGTTSGTIDGEFKIDTSVAGDYTFKIYVRDTTYSSNVLEGSFKIIPWEIKASMPEERMYVAAVNINHKIFVIGGFNPSITDPDINLLIYDPMYDNWVTRVSPLYGQWYAVANVNENIYAFTQGYGSTNLLQEYDTVADKWFTGSPSPFYRYLYAVAAVNERIYIIGGADGSGIAVNTVEEYNPSMDTWTTKASMPTARSELAVAVVDGKIYAIGGYDGNNRLNTVEEYNPIDNTWSIKTSMPATNRAGCSAAVVNSKIYVIGGAIDEYPGYSDIVEEYDPLTDTWLRKSVMPTARYAFTAITDDEMIYTIGGYNSVIPSSGYLSNVEEYYPLEDK